MHMYIYIYIYICTIYMHIYICIKHTYIHLCVYKQASEQTSLGFMKFVVHGCARSIYIYMHRIHTCIEYIYTYTHTRLTTHLSGFHEVCRAWMCAIYVWIWASIHIRDHVTEVRLSIALPHVIVRLVWRHDFDLCMCIHTSLYIFIHTCHIHNYRARRILFPTP